MLLLVTSIEFFLSARNAFVYYNSFGPSDKSNSGKSKHCGAALQGERLDGSRLTGQRV